MQIIRCIIIEDEPIAAGIVQSYIGQVNFLKLEAVYSDAISAFEILKNKTIDAIFLDIHLPGLKGIDFIRTLSHMPQIIITSAYEQYALQGFELEITDYLLKPFSFERFLKAVRRLKKHEEEIYLQNESAIRPYRIFNVNKKRVKIYLDEISYVESLKEYVRINTAERSIVTKFQLGQLREFLNDPGFIRVHRSFLVSKSKIASFSSDEIEIAGKFIPIGRSYSFIVKKELGSL